MRANPLAHVSDRKLLRDLAALVSQDRVTLAAVLAHLAEVDARRLYAPAGFPSMFAYCVEELHLSEDAAYKRIRAARTARRFPALFGAVSECRVHLTAVVQLAPYLTSQNASELIAAAEHKNKSEIEMLLAERFPRPDIAPMIRAIARPSRVAGIPKHELVPEPVPTPETTPSRSPELVPEPVPTPATAPSASPELVPEPVPTPSKITPLSPRRFAVRLTIDQSTHDKLRHAQALLSHRLPSGDLAEVLDLALDALNANLEKQKLASTERPRAARQHGPHAKRTIPARVKREVWKRDRGQCTFVSESGRRCAARKFLEFDHADPVARGGEATVTSVRLRCRAHNQLEAERVFGAGFMQEKRDIARGMSTRWGPATASSVT